MQLQRRRLLRRSRVSALSAALLVAVFVNGTLSKANAASSAGRSYQLFAHSNLVAWCIVPFDAQKRGPEARAEMLERLGFKLFAYDYRAEHIPTFDAEVEALQGHHIQLLAWWFPTEMNDEAHLILEVLKRHQLKGVQLWVMGGGESTHNETEQRARVAGEAARIRRIAEAARELDSTIGLYNHGGWFGEPENQLAIIEALQAQGITNVGIVYNQHHGHQHLERFAGLLRRMKPYLLALNLNGMNPGANDQILPIGQGQRDLELLRIIDESGWTGPIGILNHTDKDAEVRLRDNVAGLDWLSAQLRGGTPGAKPVPLSWKPIISR